MFSCDPEINGDGAELIQNRIDESLSRSLSCWSSGPMHPYKKFADRNDRNKDFLPGLVSWNEVLDCGDITRLLGTFDGNEDIGV